MATSNMVSFVNLFAQNLAKEKCKNIQNQNMYSIELRWDYA
jgi:hypothetical protein